MSNNICQLVPIIDGKPSKFYNELKRYVGNDRKLANFLYALGIQDEIISKFDKSQLNSQKEPKIEEFVRQFNIDEFLSYQTKLENDRVDIGAIDKDGNVITYTTSDGLIDKAIKYNDTHEYARAVVKYNSNGFYIDLDILNSENFNVNFGLKYNQARYGILLNQLKDCDFNTDFTDETKQFFNPLNSGYVQSLFESLHNYDPKIHGHMINRQVLSLFIDLFKDSPYIERLQSADVGDLSVLDIATMCLSTDKLNEYLNSIQDLTERSIMSTQIGDLRTIVQRFVSYSISQFKKYDPKKVVELVSRIDAGHEAFNNVDVLDLKTTLKQLYKCYHLDVDLLESIDVRIKSLSDAASNLIKNASNVNSIDRNRQAKRGVPVAEQPLNDSDIEMINKKAKNGQYAQAIADILTRLNTKFLQYEARLKQLEKNNASNTDPLKQISLISSVLIEEKLDIQSFQDLVSILQDTTQLEQDGFGVTPELMKQIQDIAVQIKRVMDKINKNIHEQELQNTYSFLKLYWGDDKINDGQEYVLQDMLRVATHDISFLDRAAYSLHECSDPVIALVGQAVKSQHEKRDNILRELNNEIRIATQKLYASGSDSQFMFLLDDNGGVIGIKSKYDYKKWYEDRDKYKEELKKQKLSRYQYRKEIAKWEFAHQTVSNDEFGLSGMIVPSEEYNLVNFDQNWTQAQKDYYNTMMGIKARVTELVGGSAPGLYKAVQLSDDLFGVIDSANGDPSKLWRLVADKFKNAFKKREDEVDYGMFGDNPLQETSVDPSGRKILGLPLFYTSELNDNRRVTKDFSRALMAFCATGINYSVMDEIADTLLMTKDVLMHRKVQQNSGNRVVGSLLHVGKTEYLQPEYKLAMETQQGKLLSDAFDKFFGKNKNVWEGNTLWGQKIQYDKITDRVIGYTSIVGLTANVLGAGANLLVGKLQMLIDTNLGMGGEFFNMKDMVFAEAEYWKPQNLASMLQECVSNNMKNKVTLLAQKFNALENFYEELQSTGFYKHSLSKILGNKSLMFMYGLGEHMLHIQGMIAVLHNIKVVDQNGNKATLYDVFDVQLDESKQNGKLVLKEGYKYLDRKGNVVGDVNNEYISTVMKRVSFVNKSFHGGFNQDDKSTAHQYALGRMFWNFRQWMPEHYARRFRGRYYNAELGEFREGYYTTAFKFVTQCIKGLKSQEYNIVTKFNELSDMEKYNLKRAISETALLALTSGLVLLFSTDDKDKKKNWSYKALLYELKRVQMETKASTFLQTNPLAFVDNLLNILNQPFAQIKTIQSVERFLNFADLFRVIESGKYKGQNKYWRNAQKNLPIIGQAQKQFEFDDSMFRIFD